MASKATISGADELFYGRGYNGYAADFWGRKGAKVMIPTYVSLGTPGVSDADYLIKAATSTELPNAETVTYLATDTDASPHDAAAATTTIYANGAAVTVWDVRDGATYGRNLISVVTHATAVVASTILISGYDYAFQPMSELHTITAGGTSKTATGTKAWSYVKSVTIISAGNSETNTLNLGTGLRLGLPFALSDTDHFIKASFGGVQELINVASNATVYSAVTSTATTSSGDVRGTISFNATLDGTECTAWYYVSGHSTGAGVYGVAQA